MGSFQNPMRINYLLIFCSLSVISADEESEQTVENGTYQIRSKVKLKPVELMLDEAKTEIETEIENLFCRDPRLTIDEALECELADVDYDYAGTDDTGLTGDVHFLVRVLLPQAWTKKDIKSHYDEEVEHLITTTQPSLETTHETTSLTSTVSNEETTTGEATTTGEVTTTGE